MPNINSQNQQNNLKLDGRLQMTVFGPTAVKLSPSVATTSGGVNKYTYLTLDSVSRFPRDGQENYNAGQTYIDFQTGTLTGSYRSYASFNKIIPASGQAIACSIHLDLNDRLYFVYGVPGTLSQVQAAVTNFTTDGTAGSLILDNYKSLVWVVVLSSTDGINLVALTGASLYDCRSFFGENKVSSKKSNHENDLTNLVVKDYLVADVAVGASTGMVFLSSTVKPGDQVTMRSLSTVSSQLQSSLTDLGQGQYSLIPVSYPSGSKAIARSTGADWILNTDYAYGNDLTTVPASGNKLYNSFDGLTLYHEGNEIRTLDPSLSIIARDLSSLSTFVPANREVAFDPETSLLKFGTDIDCGDGRDGSITLASGTNNLNASIGGLTYCRVAKVNALVPLGGKQITYSGANLNINVGDFVLLYAAQVSGSNTAGAFDLLKVTAASANSITVLSNITSGGVGTTSLYDGVKDAVWVMTVPQFASLTLQTGAVLTCNQYTSTSGAGVVPICVNGTLTFQGTGMIDVSGKGFRGATSAGAKGEGYRVGSFNLVISTTADSGGAGGLPGVSGLVGAVSTSDTTGSYSATGGSGGGSGATGGGAGGGGGYGAAGGVGGRGGAAGAGGGGGGGTSITSTGSAGTASDGGQGNNAVGASSGAAGGSGGLATGTGKAVAGTIGAAQPTGASLGGAAGLSAGNAPINQAFLGGGGGAAASGGAGGASAGNAGGAASATPGSGGAGGKGTLASTPGGGVSVAGSAIGGAGGGLAFIQANMIVNLQVSANGINGGAGGPGGAGGTGTSGAVTGIDPTGATGVGGSGAGGGGGSGGGGGGGAGGTIRSTCRTATIGFLNAAPGVGGSPGAAGAAGSGGTGSVNSFATSGGGGAGGVGSAGLAGGNGANGRVRLDYYAINSVFYPTAGSGAGGLTASSPAGYAGATNRFDTNNVITASFNYLDPNSNYNSQSESLTVQSISQIAFGSTFPIQVKQLTFTSPTQKAYPVLKGARLERGRKLINVSEAINSLGDRVIFDSGLIAANAGTKFTGLLHGLSISPAQFTPLVLVYQSSFTSQESVPTYVNSPYTNGSTVIGVFIDIHATTFDYTVGTTGLYMFVDTPSPTPLTTGFIRVLFVTN